MGQHVRDVVVDPLAGGVRGAAPGIRVDPRGQRVVGAGEPALDPLQHPAERPATLAGSPARKAGGGRGTQGRDDAGHVGGEVVAVRVVDRVAADQPSVPASQPSTAQGCG